MAFEGFFDIIQAYFTHLTGRFVFFSGRDMVLLEEWRDQGASAATICRGVRDAARAMDRSDPPRSIYNCRDFIEPYIERQRARRVPTVNTSIKSKSSQKPQPHHIAKRAMSRVEQAGFECHNEAVRALYRHAWYQIRDLTTAQLDEQYRGLLELETKLADHYLSTLPEHIQLALRARVASETGGISRSMDQEMRDRHLEARTRYHLIREYGLIPLLD